MNEIERATLVLESVIGRKKSETSKGKAFFSVSVEFHGKKGYARILP